MGAIDIFLAALHTEQARDRRPVVGARVSAGFRRQVLEEARKNTQDEGNPREDVACVKVAGIPLILGITEEILFDHLGDGPR